MRTLRGGLVELLVVGPLLASGLFALGLFATGPARAACAAPPPGGTAPPPARPGVPGLSSTVRDRAASDPESLPGLVGLAAGAGPAERRAIGAGLAQAALVCNEPDPAYARRIQEAVVRLDDPEVTLAFQAVSGDRRTGAVGEGPGGAEAPGAGGQSAGGQGASGQGASGPVAGGPGGAGVAPTAFAAPGSASAPGTAAATTAEGGSLAAGTSAARPGTGLGPRSSVSPN